MVRRKIIRAVALLMFGVVLWVWLFSYESGWRVSQGTHFIFYAVNGQACVVVVLVKPESFKTEISSAGNGALQWYEKMGGHELWGFRVGHYVDFPSVHVVWVGAPFWFISVIALLAMLFIWERAGRVRRLRAFPVRVTVDELVQ